MTRYRYLAADLVTGIIRDEVPLYSVSYGRTRNRATDLRALADARHPKITPTNLDPGRTVLYIERDGQIVADGILWDPMVPEAAGASGRELNIEADSLWSYMHHRSLDETRVYDDVDQAEILADLVAWTQGEASTDYGPTGGDPTGNIGIRTDLVVPTGTTRDRTYHGWERPWIGELGENLGGVIGGVDFHIRARWEGDGEARQIVPRLEVWESRGRQLSEIFELGRNVADYSIGKAGSRIETHVHAIGAGEEVDQLVAVVSDPNHHPTYPRLDGLESRKSVSDLSTLFGHAQGRLRVRSKIAPIVEVVLVPEATPRFSGWDWGDRARVIINDGWSQIDETMRIVSWAIDVDADGNETIRITFERPEPV